IKASADRLIRMLSKTGGTVGNFETEASTLSGMLFLKDLIPRLGRTSRIVVVTNGLLQYVPFAALADPGRPGVYQPMIFQHEIVRVLTSNEPGGPVVSLPRLDGTRDEANMIKSVLPDAELHFDWDANLETATDPKIGKFKVLHFATHGIAPDDNPELSGVVLS